MKKLLLLPLIAFFASCSTDDTGLETSQESANASYYRSVSNPTCLDAVNGTVTANLSQGINKPIYTFSATLTGMSSNVNYWARIEIENLSDCEDINSGTGEVVTFNSTSPVKVPTTKSSIVIGYQSIPDFTCYRWRFVIEGSTTIKGKGPCTTVSEWYEAPLL